MTNIASITNHVARIFDPRVRREAAVPRVRTVANLAGQTPPPQEPPVRGTNRANAMQGGVAVGERLASGPVVVHVPHDERVETLVEVFVGRGGTRRLVTAIEMLSPTNKMPGEQGRELCLACQEMAMCARTALSYLLLMTYVIISGVESRSFPVSGRFFWNFVGWFVRTSWRAAYKG